jgi:hypothetical protein
MKKGLPSRSWKMCPSPKFAWNGTVCMTTMLDTSVMVFQFSARTQIPFFYKMLKMALRPTPRAISKRNKPPGA